MYAKQPTYTEANGSEYCRGSSLHSTCESIYLYAKYRSILPALRPKEGNTFGRATSILCITSLLDKIQLSEIMLIHHDRVCVCVCFSLLMFVYSNGETDAYLEIWCGNFQFEKKWLNATSFLPTYILVMDN